MRQVVQILETELVQYIKDGKVKIIDDALIFSNDNNLKIKKFILADGYEDPFFIEFDSGLQVSIPLESFGVGNRGATSYSVAKKIEALVSALFSKQYKVQKTTLLGSSLYEVSTQGGHNFESAPSSFVPTSLIKIFGNKSESLSSPEMRIAVDNIHQVLDCDGMSSEDIEREDHNIVHADKQTYHQRARRFKGSGG